MNIEQIRVPCSLIRDKNITSSESILLSLLFEIGTKERIPENKALAKLLGKNKNKISKDISSLHKKGYIVKSEPFTDEQAFKILLKGFGKDGCLFCGYKECSLEEHHYPVRAKDGGKETISICPNCHRKFHEITDFNRNIQFSLEAKKHFEGFIK